MQETRSQKKMKKVGNYKVLLSTFENQKLAIFAKHCARVAACIHNMCPEDKLGCWGTFTEELEILENEGRGRAQDFLASLDKMKDDPETTDQLLRFVSATFIPTTLEIIHFSDVLRNFSYSP